MSWDAIIMRFGDAKSIDEFPPDFTPPPVADSATLQETLRRLFPDADHEDERSFLVGDDYWLEFNHGCHTDESGSVSAVGIRSNAGSGSIPHLKTLCDALDARLLDIQTSEFADFSSDTESSMHAFSEWRDRALLQRRNQD
ncbi:hypothetical protein NZK35_11085 [Stieleria sp. ICT_E10.1]|uniref:hypothetical protein n=1 Tax=Stieleria sedimenti TaxID=2976331 RepID=UPI0021800F5C|nr:hypothetical protein [Stieleria sedimenti]MCS7467187.1 hypothetical protein [Stieleria sedimenti]